LKAINILEAEHALILKELDLLTTAADKIGRNENPPAEFFEKAVNFTLNFTNKFHHYKEEIVMFGLLAQKHEGEIDAEVERLRSQHEALHNFMHEISISLEAYSQNAQSEVRRLHRNLSEYIDVLRRHIHAEDKVFYPLVAKTLTAEEMENMAVRFEQYATDEGANAMQDSTTLLDEMAKLI